MPYVEKAMADGRARFRLKYFNQLNNFLEENGVDVSGLRYLDNLPHWEISLPTVREAYPSVVNLPASRK